MFRIGDFSKLSHVSIKALRFYDEVGLLKPTFVDRATGYRYYSADLLSQLNRILALKELGFSLDEIALLLHGDFPATQMREALNNKREALSNKIAQDQERLMQVETWLSQIELEGRDPKYDVVLRQTPPRLVASMRDKLASYEEATELFTELDRHLKKHNAVGRHGALWLACQGQAEHIDCEVIVFLDRSVPDNKRVSVYELPRSFDACLIHQGPDQTITDAYVAAHSWINSNGYSIDGPLCELYWQGKISGNDSSGVTEIRYPIVKRQRRSLISH